MEDKANAGRASSFAVRTITQSVWTSNRRPLRHVPAEEIDDDFEDELKQ